MTRRRNILVVLGMHRSGTSFLASCMEVLGFTLPLDRTGPASDNPHGHFEPGAVVSLNDHALERVGGWWPRIGPIEAMLNPDAMTQAIDASFGDAPQIVIKDPRLSLLFSDWRSLLLQQGRVSALIALRHPAESAHSLASRDKMGADAAFLSWCHHMFEALEATAGLPRGLVLFPDWIRDVDTTLARIARIADVAVPEGAASKVNTRFDPDAIRAASHSKAPNAEIDHLGRDLFALLARHAAAGTLPDRDQLAPLKRRFEDCANPAREAETLGTRRQKLMHNEIVSLATERDRLERNADDLAAGVHALQLQLETTQQERAQIVASLSSHIAATETQRDEVIAAAKTAENIYVERIHALEALNDATANQRDEIQSAHDNRLRQIEDLSQQISQTEAHRDNLHIALDEARAQFLAETEGLNSQLQLAERQADADGIMISQLTRYLEIERQSVLKPIYRRMHRHAGKQLRRILPRPVFDALKHRVPHPAGIPTRLVYAPPRPQATRKQTFDQIPPARPDKPDIFVFSIIDWNFRIQRPQHLAREMARVGHRVFYVEMQPDTGTGIGWTAAPNVHVIRLSGQDLQGLAPYSADIAPALARRWIDCFLDFADRIGVTRRAHIVVEHPFWWNLARHLPPQFQITFDCMDEISGFSNTDQAMLDAEEDMAAHADRMIVSSQYLRDKYAPDRCVTLIRNGADTAHFMGGEMTPEGPAFLHGKLKTGALHIGYVGAIAEWFDSDLIRDAARENEDFDIHLCGSVTAELPAKLDALANVTMHGEIAYADVPGFLAAMDVLIIPFRLLPIIKACDPVKFYEYAALGKPTVATALPELERAGPLVTIAHDTESFSAGIRAAAAKAKDAGTMAALRSYALENDWSYRAVNMLAEMERAPLVSIVILSHGKADLTLAALHSLTGRGAAYPNLEILVVDNGSKPDELERLRQHVSAQDDIRLIENGRNLGFARGNNIGIGAATGEYVLLLNNDTYLAPGAIQAMVSHLEKNPQMGIVGPLTNNIGNEAKLDVAYADMSEMEQEARRILTGYRGKWTPVPVAAYFCALFRKADLDRIGYLPTVYGRGMFEDDDHCASFRAAGMTVALAEDAFVHHELSASFGVLPAAERGALFAANKAIFEKRWGKWTPHRYRALRPDPDLPSSA